MIPLESPQKARETVTEIPEEIALAAQAALDRMPDRRADMETGEFWARVEYEVVSALHDAVKAERERCANIALAEHRRRFENQDGYPADRVHDFLVVAVAIEKGIRFPLPSAPKTEGA